MVKYYILLVLLYSEILVHSQSMSERCTADASSASECFDRLSNNEKDEGYYCCFEKAKKNGAVISDCVLLSEDDYDDINSYIGDIEDLGFTDVSVVCENSPNSPNYSNYLQIGILSLLLILI